MAYIGKQPLVGNFIKLDAITASATDTYNLLNDSVAYTPQSAMNCIVSLNGVIQAPITAYTIVGTTIVFSTTLSASDTIDFIIVLGDVLDVGTVSDDTISTAKIKNLAVTAGKLAATQDLSTKTITLPASVSGLGTGITNSQLAGSIADAKITGLSSSKLSGALPAISGASLTSLNASNIGSGTVPTARLGTGTASSSTFLRGDQTYAEAGGGAYTLLLTTTASTSSEVEFTDTYLTTTYDAYFIKITNLHMSTDANLYVQFKVGGAYLTSGYTYVSWRVNAENGATGQVNGSTGATYIRMDQEGLGGAVGENSSWEVWLNDPAGTDNYKTMLQSGSGHNTTPDLASFFGVGDHQGAVTALDAIKFYPSTGTFASGTFSLYGLSK